MSRINYGCGSFGRHAGYQDFDFISILPRADMFVVHAVQPCRRRLPDEEIPRTAILRTDAAVAFTIQLGGYALRRRTC